MAVGLLVVLYGVRRLLSPTAPESPVKSSVNKLDEDDRGETPPDG